MINERELRIGNTVYGTYEDEDGKNHTNICRIIAVDETSSLGEGWDCMVELIEGKSVEVYDDFSPIPLTEEWLIRFGFEKDDMDWFRIYTLSQRASISINIDLYSCEICQSKLGFQVPCKYVHQLQNLFFCICGEELTLKP